MATDCERVLAALRTGPKSAAELYELRCIVHSRIADLRRKGHVITCERVGNDGARSYRYTLLSEADGERLPSESAALSASLSGVRRNTPQPNRPVSKQ